MENGKLKIFQSFDHLIIVSRKDANVLPLGLARPTSLWDAIINEEHSMFNVHVTHLGIGCWTFDIGH